MNNTTTELQWGDVIFKPGQRVRTTDASDYAGLEGVILEIHTGEDKETDNLTPDIHCCFDFPESEADIRKLEERFSSLYNMPKKLDELALDEVIMSPDELISIPEEPLVFFIILVQTNGSPGIPGSIWEVVERCRTW